MKKYLKLLLLLSVIFTLILLIQACRKFESSKNGEAQFKKEDAKEWYYGSFKKSVNFKQIDRSSIFAPDQLSVEVKKYPYWNKAIEYSLGSLTIVEMPVARSYTQLILPGTRNLSAKERIQVVSGVIEKVLFIKKKDGTIAVRLVTFIPDINYLKQNGFDISHNSMQYPDKEYSGYIVIKDWSEHIINFRKVDHGKYVGNVRVAKSVNYPGESVRKPNNKVYQTLAGECGWNLTPTYTEYCLNTTVGDVPGPNGSGTNCDEWTELYRGDIWEYIDCNEPDENPFDSCMNMTGNSDICNCELLGIGCGGGGGGGDAGGDGQEDDSDVVDSVEINLSDPCFQDVVNTINNSSSLGTSIGSILHETFSFWGERDLFIKQRCNSDTSIDAETSPGTLLITIALNECALQNASKEYVAASLYHEILHAYFDATGRTSELNQHNDMANKYIDAMASTLMDYFPNLSRGDAEALAWGGLQQTQAWQNLMQTDPNRAQDILFLNKKHKQGDWGTQCN